MAFLSQPIRQMLARVQPQLHQELAAVMCEHNIPALDVRIVTIAARSSVEHEVLLILASVIDDLKDEVAHEHQLASARSPAALDAAVFGTTSISPMQMVRNGVDRMASARKLTLHVAAAIDDELAVRVCDILAVTPPPSVKLTHAKLVAAAHRAFDAHDIALVTIAEHVERGPATN
ncbi:MAG: hypothetical protein QOJ63_2729 [Solirubrobacteraceae bacterium]|nr:hypothetical protein [Solirubrobacteraceae bacterium]